MNTKLKELFSNTIIFTIANFSSKILVFLMVPLYTMVLSPEDYGISDMVNTVVGLMLPVLSISISQAVLRFCFIKEFDQRDVYAIGLRFIIIGFVVSILIIFIIFFFNLLPQLGLYIWFVPIQYLLHACSTFLSNYTRGIGEVKISAVAGVVSTFTIIVLNLILLLVFKMGILGYMLSFVGGPVMSIIVMRLKLPRERIVRPMMNRDLKVQMVKFSVPLIPNDLSWWALDSFNRFFIISVLGVYAVGIYSASSKIPAILTAICGIFAQAWMLSALNEYGTEENARFIRVIHRKMFSLLSVVTSVFIILSKPMAQLLLSGDFSSSWYLIPYLMVGVFMGAMIGFYGSIYAAEKKNSMQFVSTIIGSIVSIILLFLFLRKYGIIVAAVSNMLGYMVIWLIRKEGVKKFIDLEMRTIECILQLVLLFVESVLVSFSLWYPAVFVFLIIIILDRKEMIYSFIYFKGIFVELLHKKEKKNDKNYH